MRWSCSISRLNVKKMELHDNGTVADGNLLLSS
jgi:hypothetical protein